MSQVQILSPRLYPCDAIGRHHSPRRSILQVQILPGVYAPVAQLVDALDRDPSFFTGSNPVGSTNYPDVAQFGLVQLTNSQSVISANSAPRIQTPVAQLAEALGLEPRCYWFKSSQGYRRDGARVGSPGSYPGNQ